MLRQDGTGPGFRHEALFYEDEHTYTDRLGSFVEDGLAADEPTLVLVDADKADALRRALGRAADGVTFADMREVGRNPARIIPAWEAFVAPRAAAGRTMRGIGEPIWPGRSDDELEECHIHEALINLAFADAPMWLVCPYDTAGLARATLSRATCTHPHVTGTAEPHAYAGSPDDVLGEPLVPPPPDAATLPFDATSAAEVRGFVRRWIGGTAAGDEQATSFELIVHELAANSVRHGGGRGTVRVWSENGSIVADVVDGGRIRNPLAGRQIPDVLQEDGRGLYLTNQLADLVQIRSSDTGTNVRVRLSV